MVPKKNHVALKQNLDPKFFKGADPSFVKKIWPFLEGLYKHYFRCEVSGWENLPEGPSLYVGNHNGLITFEVLMMFYAWWERFGASKQALGLAHGVALENPFFKWMIPKIGAIPAAPAYADEAFRRGFSLLVYPGGEKEAFRPFHEKAKIDFFQRRGFLKVALRNGVPIVPIVSIGAHESYMILHRGEEIAEALGLKKKYRLHGFPITVRSLFFAWCVVTGMFTFFPLLLAPGALAATFIPLPAKMKFEILPAISVNDLVNPKLSEEENLKILYDHVVGEMQKALEKGYAARRFPVLG